jgi:hypothetical protein
MNKLFTSLLLVASIASWAQLNYNSPYSIFTLGDTRSPGTMYNHSMGGVGVTNGNNLYLNLINPALLTRNKTVTFDMGIRGSLKGLETGGSKTNSLGVNFDGIFLGFPISKKFTTAIGITPFSTRSYNFETTTELSDGSTVLQNYEGSGGLSKIMWSTGWQVLSSKKSKSSLSVGLETNFVFGPLTEESSSTITTNGVANYYTANYVDRQSYSGFVFKPGFVFRKEFKIAHKITERQVWSKKANDSVNVYDYEDELFSSAIVNQVADEMVIGKYLILFAHRRDVVVAHDFVGKKLAEYFKNGIQNVKPAYMGVFIRAAASETDKATIMAEYKVLLEKYEQGLFANKTDENYSRALARNYVKRGNGVFFNFGGTYGIKSNVNSKVFNSINQTDKDGGLQSSDTLRNNERSSMTLPSYFQLGISLDKPTPTGVKRNGLAKTSVWSIALDFSKTNWSEYSNELDLFNYDDSYSISLGGEISPDITQKRSKRRASKIFYRGGLSYKNQPYTVNGENVKSLGMNVGLGFPMFGAKQLPRYINLMLGYGRRGLSESSLIKETYYSFGVSITFNNKFSRRKAGL